MIRTLFGLLLLAACGPEAEDDRVRPRRDRPDRDSGVDDSGDTGGGDSGGGDSGDSGGGDSGDSGGGDSGDSGGGDSGDSGDSGDQVVDADGDGSPEGEDCDDADAANFPGNVEACDGADNDCNGVADDGDPGVDGVESDDDGDGRAECDGDCDDADAANFPGNTEACDGADNDCNDIPDGGSPGVYGVESDDDGDGWSECDGDCDDAVAANFPGNTELCDGRDNDCNDLDDAGAAGTAGQESDDDGDGWSECDGDCDDAEAAALPGGTEVCDGADNDCSGAADYQTPTWEISPDYGGSGYGMSQYWRMQRLTVTRAVTISELYFHFEDAGARQQWAVAYNTDGSTTYTVLDGADFVASSTAYGWYGASGLAVDLEPGWTVAIGWWSEDGPDWYDGVWPSDPDWGTYEGAGYGRDRTGTLPASVTLSHTTSAGERYPIQVVLASDEGDADGDGYPACEDCDDDDASAAATCP